VNHNNKIIEIRKEILKTELSFVKKNSFIEELDNYDIPLNHSIKQRLYRLLITYEFNKKLLNFYENNQSLFHPLPIQWINLLKKKGVKISIFSPILFELYKIKIFLKAIKTWLLCLNLKKKKILKKYNYIHDLDKNVIKNINYKSNFFIWLENYLKDGVFNYYHNCKKFRKNEINQFTLTYQNIFCVNNLGLFFLIFVYLIKTTFKLLFFNNHALFLIDEIIKLKIISKNENSLPNKVLFDHSDSIFKPLWTYYLEKKNIKNIIFFYSTNNSPVVFEKKQANNIKNLITHGWELMNWKNYIVWDDYQSDYFSNYFNLKKDHFNVSGPIPYESGDLINNRKKKIISVFDVSPYEFEFYKKICLPSYYYSFENLRDFYENLCKINDDNDYQFIFKIKRISKNTSKNYINFLETLKNRGFLVYENVSTFNLIKSSMKVISLPFSSPSIIAKYYNVDSIFFDPTNKLKFLNEYKLFNRDIKILYKDEIKDWLIK